MDNYFKLGKIYKAHGLKGDLKMYVDADDPTVYKGLPSVMIQIQGSLVPFMVSKFEVRSDGKGVMSLDQATNTELVIGCDMYLPLEALPKMEDDQFYYHEVIGFKLMDKNEGELGVVEEIAENGPQALIITTYKNEEILIPISDETIVELDRENKTLLVEMPDGLLDLYL